MDQILWALSKMKIIPLKSVRNTKFKIQIPQKMVRIIYLIIFDPHLNVHLGDIVPYNPCQQRKSTDQSTIPVIFHLVCMFSTFLTFKKKYISNILKT